MLISYPFLPKRDDGTSDEDYEQSILDMEILNAGVYPASHEREWHGGIHIQSNFWEPVRAIADGVLVAYRFNDDMVKERDEDELGCIDNSFVLLKHETETDSVSGANNAENPVKVVFYSLYMHLKNRNDVLNTIAGGKPAISFIHSAVKESTGQEVKKDGKTKIYRKDILGFPGDSYSNKNIIHFEIFTTDDAINKFFVDSKNTPADIGTKGTWGDSYFVVKAGTAVVAKHPNAQTHGPDTNKITAEIDKRRIKIPVKEGTAGTVGDTGTACSGDLFVRISHKKGARYITSWLDTGPSNPPSLLTSDDGDREDDYEYNMYERASALYPSCPSAGYELLRFGKIIGPDKGKLAEAENHNWQLITFGPNLKGYIDLSSAQVLSDADFPYWMGWQKKEEGLFGDNGQCDMHDLLDVLKVDHDSEDETIAKKNMKDYISNPEHRHLQDWAQRLICKFPSEWDKANNTRCTKLKEKDGLGEGKDGPYLNKDDEYDKHIKFIESLQWWSDAGLGDSNVWHFHPFRFIRHMKHCGWLSTNEFAQCIPRTIKYLKNTNFETVTKKWDAALPLASEWNTAFNMTTRKYGIAVAKSRLIHFLAQVIPETGPLKWVREIGGENQNYSPYYGRGLIQLTHLETYQSYGNFRGFPDEHLAPTSPYAKLKWDPDRLIARDNTDAGRNTENCADSAGFFVVTQKNMLNHLDNGLSQDDAIICSKDVNGYVKIENLNGLDQRLQAVIYLRNVLHDEVFSSGEVPLKFTWRRNSQQEPELDAQGHQIMAGNPPKAKKKYYIGEHEIMVSLLPQRP